MDFYGSMITEATKCDLAIATEKGNIVVKNGDGLNEIELAKLETPEEQSLNLMPLLETNRSWRNEQTAGMDIQGNTYGNAIEYSFVTNPFGTEVRCLVFRGKLFKTYGNLVFSCRSDSRWVCTYKINRRWKCNI